MAENNDSHGSYDALLRDGDIATIRPLAADDTPALRAFLERLSDTSVRMRFFTGARRTAERYLEDLAERVHDGGSDADRYAAVAVVRGELIAVASYDREPAAASAEIAFLVADRYQSQGVGTLLLEHLVVTALADGITTFRAYVLRENSKMIEVLLDAGFPLSTRTDGSDPESFDVTLRLEETRRLVDAIDVRERRAEVNSLAPLLLPRSVAVIGAGRDPAGLGHRVLVNLVSAGFEGAVYPVNPKAPTVAGIPAYPSIGDVPAHIDLAVVATPAPAVPAVVQQCADAGVGAVIVISAGLGETSAEGAAVEAALRTIARRAGMRMVGPNCLGVVNTAVHLNASFLPAELVPGKLALISQSGALGAALVEQAAAVGVGISTFVSLGNKADVSGNDLLLYLGEDAGTDVVALYLESFGNPRKFGRIARAVAAHKPVVAITAGRSQAGGRAVRSHTAAAASPEAAVTALFQQSGVIRVPDARQLLGVSRFLLHQPLPAGRRVAIVGNSGGPGALAADACEAVGLRVPELSATTRAALRERLGPTASVGNPVDLTAEGNDERFEAAIRLALGDPAVDAVVAIYTPPFGSGTEPTTAAIERAARGATKPVLAAVLGMEATFGDAVPCYAQPEDAVAALSHAAWYAQWLRSRPEPSAPPSGLDTATAGAIVGADLARHPDGRWLDPETCVRLLSAYGVRVVTSEAVPDADAAVGAAERIGFPVVLKADGPGVVHKSDVGGVRLDIATADDVRAAFGDMAFSIEGMTGAVVQPMARGDTELIVGAVADPTFGPLVMVGLGGVTADLMGDRAFGCPPLSDAEILAMVESLRAAPLLHGYRGRPLADVPALVDLVARVARLVEDRPEIAELDLNPVLVGADGVIAVDFRVRLAPAPRPSSPLQRRLR